MAQQPRRKIMDKYELTTLEKGKTTLRFKILKSEKSALFTQNIDGIIDEKIARDKDRLKFISERHNEEVPFTIVGKGENLTVSLDFSDLIINPKETSVRLFMSVKGEE